MGYVFGSNAKHIEAEETNGWTWPSDWPHLPDPQPNQVTMLVRITQYELEDYARQPLSMMYAEYSMCPDDVVYDYGDGVVETYGEMQSSHRHFYTTTGYYVVTITSNTRQYYRQNDYRGALCRGYMAIKFGANIKIDKYVEPPRPQPTTQYIKFFGDAIYGTMRDGEFSNYFCLSKVDCIKKPTSLPYSCFSGCVSLRDINDFVTDLITVPNKCFYNCANLREINLPATTTIGDEAFCYCYGLNKCVANVATSVNDSAFYMCVTLSEIDMPSLNSVGESAFAQDYALKRVTYANGCVFGYKAFNDCYNLYPIPT